MQQVVELATPAASSEDLASEVLSREARRFPASPDPNEVLPEDWREHPTITVPHTARVLGVSRNRAYESARLGELPTIRLGARLLVPTAALRRLLGEI